MPVISVAGTRVLLAMSPPRVGVRRHEDIGRGPGVTSGGRGGGRPRTRSARGMAPTDPGRPRRATGWRAPMAEDAAQRRAERAERAEYHVQALRRRSEEESAKAQVLVDRFVERATQAGLPTEELTARPWSGRGRYRTGVTGWFLRRNGSVGVGTDGSFYVLNVAPVPL